MTGNLLLEHRSGTVFSCMLFTSLNGSDPNKQNKYEVSLFQYFEFSLYSVQKLDKVKLFLLAIFETTV